MTRRRMSKFTLSLPAERVLVTDVVSADGGVYPINSDFRVILGCIRKLSDPDVDPLRKSIYVAVHFFNSNPPPDMDTLFRAYVVGDCACDDQPPDDPLMDYEVDAEAIYAGFRQQYGIDLLRANLHWYEFRALLSGLSEYTEYRQRIKIRQIAPDDVDKKHRAAFIRVRDALAITPRVSKAEQLLQEELDRRLANGEDPSEIIKQLQEV